MIKNENKRFQKNKRNYTNIACSFNSTKLLVPRNGPNVEEGNNIEKKLNLYYNIIM